MTQNPPLPIMSRNEPERAARSSSSSARERPSGKEAGPPEDHGFMYSRSFEDLDGHHWEVVWMDPKEAVQ